MYCYNITFLVNPPPANDKGSLMRTILVVLALLGGAAKAQVPNVVTDIAPVQSLTALVMGDLGQPVLLLDPDVDPHDFQMRPSQARALAEAGIVIWTGAEMTPWLDRMVDSFGNDPIRVELLALADLPLRIAQQRRTSADDNPAIDPHAWLDPLNAARFVTEIAGTLAKADPENAETYRTNAARAQARIKAMTDELAQQLQPARQTKIVTYHDAYRYLLTRFDLQFAGSLAPSDAAPPSAARIAEIRDLLAANPTACVFGEPGANPKLIKAVLPDPDTVVTDLGPLNAGQPPGPMYYEALIGRLANTIAACANR